MNLILKYKIRPKKWYFNLNTKSVENYKKKKIFFDLEYKTPSILFNFDLIMSKDIHFDVKYMFYIKYKFYMKYKILSKNRHFDLNNEIMSEIILDLKYKICPN